MNRAIYLLIAVSFATTAFFVQPAQAQVSTSDVEGMACIASSYEYDDWCEPLPGAEARLQNAVAGVSTVDKTATSGDDGRFIFEDVPEGEYTLTLSRQGFGAVEASISAPGEGGEHHMAPQTVSVAGTIVDADGAPIDAAYISFWGQQSAETKVDDGAFSVELWAGWYNVNVEAPGHGTLDQRLLLDGSDITIEMPPMPERDVIVRGQVVDQDGVPVADADVISEQWQVRSASGAYQYGDYRNMTSTDAEGRYELGVFSGHINLRFQKEGHATVHEWTEAKSGDEPVIDVELLRYPEKTAKIQGHITGLDGGLRYASISLYHPQYGLHECSIASSQSNEGGRSSPGEPAVTEDRATIAPYPYYERECSITIDDDGRFEGMVTPGYAILNVHHNHWQTCSETTDADGTYTRSCGPQYHSYVQTLNLPADETTTLDIQLQARPQPDAVISGYVVDGESGKAIPRVHVSFSNEENYGWGSATTDGDGSFKVRLHGGLHRINVWAEGYLPWQGMVDLDSGSELPYDIFLTPGQESGYGGCCYAYADAAIRAEATPQTGMAASDSGVGAMPAEEAPASGDDGAAFEDLGGGLGPYNAAERAELTRQDNDAPAPFVLLIAGLVALAVLRKRE